MRPLRSVRPTASFTRRRSSKTCAQNAAQITLSFSQSTFANQGNQGRAQDTAKITTRRKSSEWSAFWKNLLRRYCPVRRLPDIISDLASLLLCSLSSSFSGAGEGIRTPDPLITNQMLYRLSYASNWGKARLRASLSHGSLPDVRDNYLRYHKENKGRNTLSQPL